MNTTSQSREVVVDENFIRWPFRHMHIGEYFIIKDDMISFGQAKGACAKFRSNDMKFSCKVIRNRDGYFRHGIITRTD
jgi:hypothetical protein